MSVAAAANTPRRHPPASEGLTAPQDSRLQAADKVETLHRKTVGRNIQGQKCSYYVLRALSITNHANSFLVCPAGEHTSFLQAEAYTFNGLCPQLLRSRKRHLKRRQKASLDHATLDGQVYLIFDLANGRGWTPKLPEEKYVSRSIPDVVMPKPVRPLEKYVRALEASTARDVASVLATRVDAVLETSKKLVDTCAGLDWSDGAMEQSRATARPLEEAVTDARAELASELRRRLQIDWDQGAGKESRECLRSFWEWDAADRAYRELLHDCGYARPARPGETAGGVGPDGAKMRHLQSMEESCVARWQVFMHFLDSVLGYRELLEKEQFQLEFDYNDLEKAKAKMLAKITTQEVPEVSEEESADEAIEVSRKTVKQREKRRLRRARARCAKAAGGG